MYQFPISDLQNESNNFSETRWTPWLASLNTLLATSCPFPHLPQFASHTNPHKNGSGTRNLCKFITKSCKIIIKITWGISQGEKVNTNSKSFLPRHTHVQRYKHTQFGTQGKESIWDANNISFSVDIYVNSGCVWQRGSLCCKIGPWGVPSHSEFRRLKFSCFS